MVLEEVVSQDTTLTTESHLARRRNGTLWHPIQRFDKVRAQQVALHWGKKMMRRLFLLFAAVGGFSGFISLPAHAQSAADRERWDRDCRALGGRLNWNTGVCEGAGQSNPSPVPDSNPVYDQVSAQFAANVGKYDTAMGQLGGLSSSANPFLGLPRPSSEVELSSRLDSVLGAVWSEFSAVAFEAGRLRAQASYFDGRNNQLRESVEWQRGQIAEISSAATRLRQQISAAEARLPEAKRLERETSALALAQLNNRTGDQRAIATLLAFAPSPYSTVAEMDGNYRYTTVPGAQAEPGPPLASASFAAAEAASGGPPLSSSPLRYGRPAATASVDDKLGTLQWVAGAWRYDLNELPQLRAAVPNKQAESASLAAQSTELGSTLWGLDSQRNSLVAQLQHANSRVDTALANAGGASAVIIKEVLADIAFDHLADTMRGAAESIAGAEGIDVPAPPTDSRSLLDWVRRGGRVVLPVTGYAAQWESFNDAQQNTIDVIGRGPTTLASEAAEALGNGSVAEAEAVMERTFANVRWEVFNYIKTIGFGSLPEGEDKGSLLDFFDRYGEKVREQDSGGG